MKIYRISIIKLSQYGRYIRHVAKNIGGIYNTPRTIEDSGNSKEFVTASIQKGAILFLNDNLFTTPIWLIDQELITKAGIDPVKMINDVQKKILDRLKVYIQLIKYKQIKPIMVSKHILPKICLKI